MHQRPRRRYGWSAVVLCGALLAIGLPVGWWVAHPAARPTTQINPGEVLALARSSSAPTPAPTAAAAGPQRLVVPVQAGSPAAGPALAAPVQLQIPALGVDAPIEAEGVNAEGEMALPSPVHEVGWYRFGPAPGAAAGSIVVAGHVDAAKQGEGALFRLRDVPAGATITLTTSDGRVWRYRVVSREEFSKRSIPLAQIFTRTGAPHLTVITCGGTFNRTALSYDDNIVVTAVPF